MKSRYILIMLLLLGSRSLWAQKTDFSGEFTINKTKSQWNGAPEYVLPKLVKVVQQKKVIYITKVNLNSKMEEQPIITDTLDYKGTAFFKPAKAGGEIETVLKWLNDQSFRLDIASPTIKMYEVWMMEDNGQTLHFTRVMDVGNGNSFTFQAFFDRKKEN